MSRHHYGRSTYLLLVLAFGVVTFLINYAFIKRDHSVESKLPLEENTGLVILCSYHQLGNDNWHDVRTIRNYWLDYVGNKCSEGSLKRVGLYKKKREVRGLEQPGVSTRIYVLNSCTGNWEGSSSLLGVYSFMDGVVSCAKIAAIQHPDAVLAWRLTEWKSAEVEIQELFYFALYQYMVDACGLLVFVVPRSSSDVEEQQLLAVQQLQLTARHHPAPTIDEVAKRIVDFQRISLARYIVPGVITRRCGILLYTRKHDPFCHPARTLAYPLLISGLGGAGTHYAAQQLASDGWRVRHEELDVDGAVVSPPRAVLSVLHLQHVITNNTHTELVLRGKRQGIEPTVSLRRAGRPPE
jgi:hypothetical protein